MNEQETIAQRIIKLLAKAERAGTPEEAEAFFAKAAALQAKHAIDEMMLNSARGETSYDHLDSKEFKFEGSYRKAHASMVFALARVMDCKGVIFFQDGKREWIRIHGFASDLAQIEVLFTSLAIQATRACKKYTDNYDVYKFMTAAERFQTRKSFIIGFGNGAAEKVKEAREAAVQEKEAEAGEPGVSLVLVDRRTQVTQDFAEKYPRLGRARGTKVTGSASAGRAEGRRADIGGSRIGGGSQRSLGR